MIYIYQETFHRQRGKASIEACAYTEEQPLDCFERKLLFTVPEQWLPNNKEQFLKACAYYNVQVPENIVWIGYVPF